MATDNNRKNSEIGGVPPLVRPVVENFIRDIVTELGANLGSMALTGSVLTKDFIPQSSDINSVVVLKEMDFKVLDGLSVLGRKYRKKRIRAPLLMTPEYISRSLDVFPVEFLDIKVLHRTIYGPDIFSDLKVERPMLRVQCERDLKSRLINLRQGYIKSVGLRSVLLKLILDAYSGFFPLFRAIIYVVQDLDIPPIAKNEVLDTVESTYGVDMSCFRQVMELRLKKRPKLGPDEISRLFQEVYLAIERLAIKLDEIRL